MCLRWEVRRPLEAPAHLYAEHGNYDPLVHNEQANCPTGTHSVKRKPAFHAEKRKWFKTRSPLACKRSATYREARVDACIG